MKIISIKTHWKEGRTVIMADFSSGSRIKLSVFAGAEDGTVAAVHLEILSVSTTKAGAEEILRFFSPKEGETLPQLVQRVRKFIEPSPNIATLIGFVRGANFKF